MSLNNSPILTKVEDFDLATEIDPEKILWDDRYGYRNITLEAGTKILLGYTWGYLNDGGMVDDVYDLVIELKEDTTALEGWAKLIEAYGRHMESLGGYPRSYFFEGMTEENGYIKYIFGT